MKKLFLAALCVLAFATFSFAQDATASPSPSPKPKPKMTKAQILKKLSANETAIWNAFKAKDVKPFQNLVAADSVAVGEEGVTGKADAIKMLPSMPCEIKSFTLSDWKLTMAGADSAIVTYKGVTEGTCAGQPVPTVWALTVWTNRKGKWVATGHSETPVKP